MQAFPHHYDVSAMALPEGDLELRSARLPTLSTAAPVEFDGPGERWSPETLLVAAVADCFTLTFRGVARVNRVAWTSIECDVRGTLERVDGVTKFTAFAIRAHLVVPDGATEEAARRALEKAERTCLITNSLTASVQLEATVDSMAESAARSR
jgi:organic hydroperoxide reductase OsmC/OhrA